MDVTSHVLHKINRVSYKLGQQITNIVAHQVKAKYDEEVMKLTLA